METKSNCQETVGDGKDSASNLSIPSEGELKAEEQKRISKRLIWYALVAIVTSSVIVFVCPCLPHWLKLVFEIISGVAASILAGGIVAYTADIPSIVGSFKSLIVNSLISNSYLENIDKYQLKSIKKTVVKNLHKKVNLPESLLQLDTRLGEIFEDPYYSFFNEIVFCHKKGTLSEVSALLNDSASYSSKAGTIIDENGKKEELVQKDEKTVSDTPPEPSATPATPATPVTSPVTVPATNDKDLYVLKDITNEFEIINPTPEDIIADIGIRKSFVLPNGKNIEDLFFLQQFEVTIDDSKTVDIGVDVEVFKNQSVKRSSPETMTYNSTLGVIVQGLADDNVLSESNINDHARKGNPGIKDKPDDSPSELKVKFKKSVKVMLKYRMIISVEDSHFTRRMRYSAKTFLLNYNCEDSVQIHGQVLGTLVKQEKITIVQDDNHKNSILIQCRDWLLPGNGIFIVLDDKN